ncbi:hypothetical protein LVB77_19130 [Lysobacter sp. 5GHs7-4]|uniref:hypothetical protein n=1 Tax=Lysobacter sp. 5GHs7-4 TaxID=2904253 RepID=UPI001E544DB2|nr:hypothetical protein [Lysobacter sp. 5GHs7-4]UHQ22736.1 hypothetical protein LVB77_19130 [Lysobacter sp. 5GHs7-4]
MKTRNSRTALALLLACAALAAGCRLERSALNGMGQVTPMQYCPGDTVTASYDLLREETCPADVDCAMHFPTMNITSAPEAFPPRTVRAFADSFTFAPSADSVAVTFDIDRDAVTIPTSRFDGSTRIFVQRTNLRDQTHTISRITGTLDSELLHEGVCSGNTPVNLPAEIPGPPRLSPNMRLSELCNTNGVPIMVEVSTTSGSMTFNLLPGRCLQPGVDGVPADLANARTIGVSAPDLSARCSATMQQPPRPLRTVARMACR